MERDIIVISGSETAYFAASELARYLRIMSVVPVAYIIRPGNYKSKGIRLGLFSEVSGSAGPKVKGRPGADSIAVNIADGEGYIAGSNPHSVLMGVYRSLHKLGCRWVRPGSDGEYIPSIPSPDVTVVFEETASYDHRTICIEGAVSVENVTAVIDWAPKNGFSGYFMQFPFGDAFYDRWYSHPGNPTRGPDPFSRSMARQYSLTVEQELKKRGMAYHAVGHGWTCRALGMDIADWDPHYTKAQADAKELIAEVNGKREYFWDRPMITSLCFGNPDVMRKMVDTIVGYAAEHPEVDYLHLWLDDGGNNKCECPKCKGSLPADLYVKMLEQIDKELTKRKIPMKLVFLSYSDLLWPPKAKVSLNTDRFVFMYANSRESYSQSLDAKAKPTVPAYVRNHSKLTRDDGEFNGFLKGWKNFYKGDSFLFEYYMTIGTVVFNQLELARVINADVRLLKEYGLNGIVSCQAQRVFFPTGLPVYVLGHSLWQVDVNFTALQDDYYHACFGKESAFCKELLKVIAEEIYKTVRIGGSMAPMPGAVAHLEKLTALVADLSRMIDRNGAHEDVCRAWSWHYLRWYVRLLETFTGLLRKVVEKASHEELIASWKQMQAFIYGNEDRFQMLFDVNSFARTFDRYVLDGKHSTAPQDVVQ